MPKTPQPGRPESLDILLPDLNGIPRGQRIRGADAAAALRRGLPWPSSLFAMRFDGHIVEETGLGLRAGDPDFPCRALPETHAPTPWRTGGAQAVFEMRDENGEGFFADPREALRRVVARLNNDGVFPAVAFEMEFFILENNGPVGAAGANGNLHSLDEISRRARLLDLIHESAERQRLPAFAALSEDAPGQFEVKLRHAADPMLACLHAILLRRAVRECARFCGTEATFLAKPFADATGSGMHVHVSATASAKGGGGGMGGRKIFADEKILESAVAGTLEIAREGTAFFAPFGNSYRRFLPGCYAPTGLSWGRENRTVTTRLPRAEKDSGKRLEFRLPGADANPHLVLAAILAGVHHGLSKKLKPPPETKGDASARKNAGAGADGDGSDSGSVSSRLPLEWRGALDALGRAKILPSYLGADFVRHYLVVKESEWRDWQAHVSDYDRDRYRVAI